MFEYFFENLSKKFKFHFNMTRMTGTLREDLFEFLFISRSVLLRMKILKKNCTENQNIFLFDFVFRKSCVLYDNMGKHCRTRDTPDDNIAHKHCVLDT